MLLDEGRSIVEYKVGKERVLTLGHHNGIYTDKKSKESNDLRKLTNNILTYLAENSEFLTVELAGKLATTWSWLKRQD